MNTHKRLAEFHHGIFGHIWYHFLHFQHQEKSENQLKFENSCGNFFSFVGYFHFFTNISCYNFHIYLVEKFARAFFVNSDMTNSPVIDAL